MKFQGFTLDKFQEDAANSVNNGHSVVVSAPTGSGKTLIADYIIDKYLKTDERIIYTAPIKALSNQKFKDFTETYGKEKIGLITGDLVINSTAQVLIMTTEVYRNMAIIEDPVLNNVSYCIFDEIHYISDEERGYIWEESIIFSAEHIKFLFLSATIPNAEEFAQWVMSIKNHQVDVVNHDVRPVPLDRKFYDQILGITTLSDIIANKEHDYYPNYHDIHRRRGRIQRRERVPPPSYRDLIKMLVTQKALPCIYFVFSRAKTQEYARTLAQKNDLLNPAESSEVSQFLSNEFRALSKEVLSLKSAYDLRFCLGRGIAFHNAGILPEMKHIVETLFGKGLIKVLFATETFAVGINMPAKTVCFDGLRKYTGVGFRYLSTKEYFQMAGRAGRRGIDKKGLAVAIIHRPSLEMDVVERMTKKDIEPLKSQFRLTPNTVLNMINLHSPEEIKQILMMNFFSYQQLKGKGSDNRILGSIKARFTKLIKTLNRLSYIEGGQLTNLGYFASKMFAYELEATELFARSNTSAFDEHDILLLTASLVYESKRGVRFFRIYDPKRTSRLLHIIEQNKILRKGKWDSQLEKMNAIIDPLMQGKKFIEILKNTNMPEGDLIRILMRIVDMLEQIDRATIEDEALRSKVRNCKELIKDSLEGIQVI